MPLRYTSEIPLSLESGATLPAWQLAYTTYGTRQPDDGNVVWICHALTANADPAAWWPGMVGPGKYFDPVRHFIICANVIGSCYGSTGPLSDNPATAQPYYHDFPPLTPRDAARALEHLRQHLGIARVEMLVGASLGGQYALEWAIACPEAFENLLLMATNARHSPWGIACNEAQRMAIAADGTWADASPTAGLAGMRAARAMALLTYRSYDAYGRTQDGPADGYRTDFRASTYQRYQGEKLARRFNAFSYWTLSRMMDAHDVGRARGGVTAALARVRARTLAIGIRSDGLFPVSEQQLLAGAVPDGQYVEIDSPYGHDGFLIEADTLTQCLRAWERGGRIFC